MVLTPFDTARDLLEIYTPVASFTVEGETLVVEERRSGPRVELMAGNFTVLKKWPETVIYDGEKLVLIWLHDRRKGDIVGTMKKETIKPSIGFNKIIVDVSAPVFVDIYDSEVWNEYKKWIGKIGVVDYDREAVKFVRRLEISARGVRVSER